MNFRQPLLGFYTLGTVVCGLPLMVVLLLAPSAHAASSSIPLEIRTNPNAQASKALIDQVITSQIALMTSPATVHDARETLIDQVGGAGGQVPSGPYLDLYAQDVNTLLTPLLSNPDQTIRLNAAIVVAGVAEKVDNVRLLPVTLQLLNDKSDAVLIWSLRAARFVLPPAITINQQAKLLAAIKVHAGPNANPMLLQLVYEALSPAIARNDPNGLKIGSVVVPELHGLLTARIEELRKEVPPDLLSVKSATDFLSTTGWNNSTAPLQLKTIQIFCDLIGVAGERADASNGIDKDQLIEVVQQVTHSLAAASLTAGANDISNSLLSKLALKSGAANVAAITSQVQPLIRTFPAWATVAPPPHILAGGAGAAPTTTAAATPASRPGSPAAAAK